MLIKTDNLLKFFSNARQVYMETADISLSLVIFFLNLDRYLLAKDMGQIKGWTIKQTV